MAPKIIMPLAEHHADGVSADIRWQVEIVALRHPYLWLSFINGGNGEKFNAVEEIRFSLSGNQSSTLASALLAASDTAIRHLLEVAPAEGAYLWYAASETVLLDCGQRHGRLQLPLTHGQKLTPGLSIGTFWNGLVLLAVHVKSPDDIDGDLRLVDFMLTVAEARLLALALLSAIGEVRHDVGA